MAIEPEAWLPQWKNGVQEYGEEGEPLINMDASGAAIYTPPTTADGRYLLSKAGPNEQPWNGLYSSTYDANAGGWVTDKNTWQTEFDKNRQEGYKNVVAPKDFMSLWGPAIVGAIGGGALYGAAGGAASSAGAVGSGNLGLDAVTLGEAVTPWTTNPSLAALEGAGEFAATGAGAGSLPATFGGGSWTAEELASMGLDPITTGEVVNPWTTNPSLAELGGATASGETLLQQAQRLLTPTPTSVASSAAQRIVGDELGGTDETADNLPADERAGGDSSGSTGSTIADKLLQKLMDNPLTAAAVLGTLAAQNKQNKGGETQAQKLNEIAAPVSGVANDLLEKYKSGEINAGDKFDIDTWEQQQIAKTKNYFAKAGMTTSSSANHAVQQIQAQATAMREKARQGLLSQGLNASQIAYPPLRDAITAQANQDAAFSQSQASALQALMLLAAMENRTPIGAK